MSLLSAEPMETFDIFYKTDNPPIRLSYHGNVHYNSIVDPYSASIDLGLGLPGYQPGKEEPWRSRSGAGAKISLRAENCSCQELALVVGDIENHVTGSCFSVENRPSRQSVLSLSSTIHED
ncbi:hypothetical protein RRG08_061953 [Elysia crispata]|uniref:Deubiquitinating enzyme A n=1 Tax=Elysia crispata TaxID=231223 RepID=A0AAE0ZJN3_9GAST|nr:hypothetical protein RRG08_061953 [Elysia crispata]